MASISITKTYQDGSVLSEADLDNIKTSVETFLNTTKINDDNIQTAGITASTKIVSGSITGALLNSAIVDDSTIEISSNTLQVKDGGITGAKLASGLSDARTIKSANPTAFDFVDGDVSTANDTITETSHGFDLGQVVQLTTTGTLPGGLATGTDYYIIKEDDDTVKLASTEYNAFEGTAVDITSAAGGGTHTLTANSSNVLQAIQGPFTSLKYQEFLASDTWTVPQGCYRVIVQASGGGGGGGGGAGNDNNMDVAGAGAGGSGADISFQTIATTPGESVTITIGGGGSGGGAGSAAANSTGSDGSTGSNTTFAATAGTLTFYGGQGGEGGHSSDSIIFQKARSLGNGGDAGLIYKGDATTATYAALDGEYPKSRPVLSSGFPNPGTANVTGTLGLPRASGGGCGGSSWEAGGGGGNSGPPPVAGVNAAANTGAGGGGGGARVGSSATGAAGGNGGSGRLRIYWS